MCARVHKPSILLDSGDNLFVVSQKMWAILHSRAALRSTRLLLRTRLSCSREFMRREGAVSSQGQFPYCLMADTYRPKLMQLSTTLQECWWEGRNCLLKKLGKISLKAIQLWLWYLCFREPIITAPYQTLGIHLLGEHHSKDLWWHISIYHQEGKEKQPWELRLNPILYWQGARVPGSQTRSPAKHHSTVCNENVDIIPCSANIFSVWECSELWQGINIFFGRQSFSQKPNWVENWTSYLKK